MTRISQLCAILLLALATAGAQAANYAGTTFEIEMIVFSHSGGMEQSRESWPATPRLQYPEKWVDFDSTKGDSLFLSPVAPRLNNKVAALDRSGNYRVLFHKTWRQVLQQKHNSPAILISGGDTVGDHHRLEGSVTLSVSRYLHLSTDLWLNDFGNDTTRNTVNGPETGGVMLPRRPSAKVAAADEPAAPGSADSGFRASSLNSAAVPAPAYAQHVALLREERRMRSGELHYIDNPAFGVLIEVRTVEKSEE
ncbi:CsiV family protein [Microbulbifer halophilus]|uniref:CsiV family protein n=1 Tax=Microbulbifer halophilus TaxID=453963 RepID=A0ABW5EFQ3_9GAMM|nr:CsiV family protein [Microbulbifer halophilus]MCW8128213.1 CsiV family protein [Microbulbifer halophilus]